MSKTVNKSAETDVLPIDNFWEHEISFDVASLRFTSDQIRFLFGTTNGRPNIQYFFHALATMTVGSKKETVRGVEVKTTTCERQLAVASLEALWGMKRKQARNLLDKMEQLKLIRRTHDNVTSIVNFTCVWGIWKNNESMRNPNHEALYRSVPLTRPSDTPSGDLTSAGAAPSLQQPQVSAAEMAVESCKPTSHTANSTSQPDDEKKA